MDIKKIIIVGIGFLAVIFTSEFANYLSRSDSPSSEVLNTAFINKSISEARINNFDGAIYNLSLASRLNIFGEYDAYRRLLPKDYLDKFQFSEDGDYKNLIIKYLTGLTQNDLLNSEDQGLGRIFYNLAKVSYANGETKLSEYFFKQAMYNNPEFASFHAELINYYFTVGMKNEMNKQMDYCLKFKGAKTLCEQYSNDSLKLNIAKPIGYMSAEVDRHYLGY